IALDHAGQAFLNQVNQLILDNITEASLRVDPLADRMHMSRPTLYVKITALSDLSPNDRINVTRLTKAARRPGGQQYRVYEVSSLVGFSSSSHFIRNFQKQFGISPKEWADQHRTSA